MSGPAPAYTAIMSGLGSAGCFGVGDFFATRLSRAHGWLRTFFWLQVLSFPILALVGLVEHGVPQVGWSMAGTLVGLGLLNAVGALGLYRAFEVGTLSVVSPVASTFGAVTVALAIAFGDPPPLTVLPALGLVVAGVAAASVVKDQDSERLTRSAGIGWALLASLGFGAMFFGLDRVVDDLGPAWPVASFRLVAMAILIPFARHRGEALRPLRGDLSLAAAVALLDSAGMVLYAFGTTVGHVGVVAVLASLFSAVTVVLAQTVLRERLSWWQWVGVLATLGGVAWVSALTAS